MTNPFIIVRDFFVNVLRPDLDGILGTFAKAERKLGTFVRHELNALGRETSRIIKLENSRKARNASIDRAYRTIHNINQLTA